MKCVKFGGLKCALWVDKTIQFRGLKCAKSGGLKCAGMKWYTIVFLCLNPVSITLTIFRSCCCWDGHRETMVGHKVRLWMNRDVDSMVFCWKHFQKDCQDYLVFDNAMRLFLLIFAFYWGVHQTSTHLSFSHSLQRSLREKQTNVAAVWHMVP